MNENQEIILRYALDNQSNCIGVVPCYDERPTDSNEYLRMKVGDISLHGLQSVYADNHIYFLCRVKDVDALRMKFWFEKKGSVLIKNIESHYSKQLAEMKAELDESVRRITG